MSGVLLMSLPPVERPRPGSGLNRVGLGSKRPELETSPPTASCALCAKSFPLTRPVSSFVKQGSVSLNTVLTAYALKCRGVHTSRFRTQIRALI